MTLHAAAATIVTFDVDWAPDWMIDDALERLARRGIKSTWFVTHASPAIERLRGRGDLVELGIHPNCLPGSSHGGTEAEALAFVKRIVPDAVCMRTHSLYQTSPFLLRAAAEFGIRLDSSLYVPERGGIPPHDWRVDDIVLRRVPFGWADDLAMRAPRPDWSLPAAPNGKGPRVFDFHPVHVALNTGDYAAYEKLKARRPLPQWTQDFVAPHRGEGPGVGTFLEALLTTLSGRPTFFLRDLLDVPI
jgi:hypothetical protein